MGYQRPDSKQNLRLVVSARELIFRKKNLFLQFPAMLGRESAEYFLGSLVGWGDRGFDKFDSRGEITPQKMLEHASCHPTATKPCMDGNLPDE